MIAEQHAICLIVPIPLLPIIAHLYIHAYMNMLLANSLFLSFSNQSPGRNMNSGQSTKSVRQARRS